MIWAVSSGDANVLSLWCQQGRSRHSLIEQLTHPKTRKVGVGGAREGGSVCGPPPAHSWRNSKCTSTDHSWGLRCGTVWCFKGQQRPRDLAPLAQQKPKKHKKWFTHNPLPLVRSFTPSAVVGSVFKVVSGVSSCLVWDEATPVKSHWKMYSVVSPPGGTAWVRPPLCLSDQVTGSLPGPYWDRWESQSCLFLSMYV